MNVLYRFFDEDGTLLYIGITNNVWNRFKGHAKSQPWWELVATATFEHYGHRDALERAESLAIHQECPKYNVIHNAAEKPDPIHELLNRVAYLEAKLQRITPYTAPNVQVAELPSYLTRSQLLDATGLSEAKFNLLKRLDLLPDRGQKGAAGRWFFERSAAVEFALSDICEVARLNTIEGAESILGMEASRRKAAELEDAL